MEWQIESIAALQTWRALDAFMRVLTWLGNEEFYLLLIPLFYLAVNPRTGLRLGLLLLLGDAFNNLIKVGLAQPRPFWLGQRVRPLALEASYGFPSSHAQNAASVWLFLAGSVRKPWAWLAALALILLISLSRVYLGVHFWSDILGGWLLGVLFLALFLKFEPRARAWFEAAALPAQFTAATALPLGLMLAGVLLYNLTAGHAAATGTAWSQFTAEARSLDALTGRAGALWGLGAGYALTLRYARFEIAAALPRRIAAFCLGLLGVMLFKIGLGLVFPAQPEVLGLIFRFVRYALMAFWIVFLAPWLLLRWKLAVAPIR